ncbi:MAG: hypothetical protein EBR54_04815 [Flavobacteriia bacterium]|nr:hypothetical protein [Flavobacteriia bacterium]
MTKGKNFVVLIGNSPLSGNKISELYRGHAAYSRFWRSFATDKVKNIVTRFQKFIYLFKFFL